MQADPRPPAHSFFLPAPGGPRYCILHHPDPGAAPRGVMVYVPPFGEEMNKSRRMAALQARRFARMGFAVLQPDLLGCGDSAGDLAQATWAQWREDVFRALAWLSGRFPGPAHLWGLRLGALLALDCASGVPDAPVPIDRVILWQPVAGGDSFLTQFLRLKLANAVVNGDGGASPGVRELRAALAAGETLEVAGYPLPPSLAASLDSLRLDALAAPRAAIDWFEVMASKERGIPPAVRRTAEAWSQRGMDCTVHLIEGLPFWSTQELAECPELIERTCGLFEEVKQ